MISLDFSVVYQIILFLVLWVILNKIFFQPYLRLLEERERRTSGAQQDSVELEHEGVRLKTEYEDKIGRAQAAGYAAKDAIVQDGRRQREKILTEAREEAAGTLERVRRDVATSVEQEKQVAAVEVVAVARDMVSKVLGRRVA
jgi:F-type H+-transporting ATPase subunit b